jgi:hypothetical protein
MCLLLIFFSPGTLRALPLTERNGQLAELVEAGGALIRSLRDVMFIYTQMLIWWGLWLPKPPECPKA